MHVTRTLLFAPLLALATATMTPEQLAEQEATRAQLQAQVGDPYAGLAPEVAAAIQARFDELAALEAQAIAIRMNAAG